MTGILKMKNIFLPLRQWRRTQPFLVLEIRMLNVRLHKVEAAHNSARVTLLNECAVIPGDAPMLAEKIRSLLGSDSEIRNIALIMNSPLIRHQTLGIPIMSSAERQKVVPLEMKHSIDAWETAGTISYWSAGRIRNDEVAKEYVLCAELPRVAVDEIIAIISEQHYNIIGFTSHAQMVCHLLKECRTEDNLNVALLEINEHEGSVTLFHSGIWTMDRHFLTGRSADVEPGKPAELDIEKLRLEVGRALQYFKQQVRSENIGQIFLYGTTREAGFIKSQLESFFRIPVIPIAKEKAPEEMGGEPEGTPLLDLPHVAARNTQFDKYIDFLPPQWRMEKQKKAKTAALVCAAALLYCAMGGVILLLQREVAIIEKTERTQPAMLAGATQSSEKMKQLQSSRTFALATEQSDNWSFSRHKTVAAIVREMAAAAPSEMSISDLEIAEKGGVWQVKLKAEIRSANGSRSQQLFLKFQEQMQRFPRLKQLTWGGVQLADATATDESVEENLLTFSMHGILSAVTHQ